MIGTVLIDRYKINSELGRGGMGTVYRAHDTILKRDVAIKLLSETRLGTEGSTRLLREAQTVAQLSHSNIVNIFDAGEHDGSPFIVMELVAGKTLYDQKPDSLEEIIGMAAQICAALDHAHKQGIIHRDLKPENVIVEPSGNLKLMDFGLARSVASRMTSEGSIVGTVLYMPPEQAMGDEVDPRADLYSLGVMLYELTTGQLPFEDENPIAIITQHIHSPVVPPQAKRENIPGYLNNLILKLMEKDPNDRPENASAVLAILSSLEEIEDNLRESKEVNLLDRIVRGRMVGRREEYEEARQIWSQVTAGAGKTLLISGEPGVGKTRLMREVFTQAEVSGGQAHIGESYAESNTPYGAFSQIIRHSLSQNMKNGASFPDEVLDDLLNLTPDLRPKFPDVKPNPKLDPEAEQNRLVAHMVIYCQILSEKKPLLWIVDDIHWSDSSTLTVFHQLARQTRNMAVMLLGTYREVELRQAQAFNEMLLELNRQRIGTRIKLNRLTVDQTENMLAEIFQEEITPEFLQAIYRETDGNPFFIEEISRALVENGKLVFIDGRWDRPEIEEMEIPQGIQVAVESRLSKLPEGTQNVLRMAAVLGREFEFDILLGALGGSEDRLIDALENAEQMQMTQEVSGRKTITLAFVHALVPHSIRENINTLRRRKLHKQALTAYEAQQPDNYEALAFHSLHGGDDANALKYFTLAGERALATYANQDAVQQLLNALELVEVEAQEASLLASIGEAQTRLSHHQEAVEIWRRAIEIYLKQGNLNEAAQLYAQAGRALYNGEDAPGSLEICLEGMRVVKDAPDGPGLARLIGETARAYIFNARFEESRPLAQQALEMGEKLNLVDVQVNSLNEIALNLLRQYPRETEQVGLLYQRAIELTEEANLWREACRSHTNWSVAYTFQGNLEKVLYHRQQALKLARQAGDLSQERFSLGQVINTLRYLGRGQEALALMQRFNQLCDNEADEELGNILKEEQKAHWDRYLGYLDKAIKGYKHKLKYYQQVNHPMFLNLSLSDLSSALYDNINYEEAIPHLQQIMSNEESGETVFYTIGDRAQLAASLAHLGKVKEARQQLNRARAKQEESQYLLLQITLNFYEAQILALEEKWDEAFGLFDKVQKILVDGKWVAWQAGNLHTWGIAHLRRGKEEDKVRAKELLEQALDLYEKMEAGGWVKRVQELLAEPEITS